MHKYSEIRAWKTSLIVEVMCFWAVPVFFMLTRTTLMDYRKKYDTKTFIKKRIKKVGIPFVFWIFVMSLWKSYIGELSFGENIIRDFFNKMFSNKIEYTYYFLFAIIGVYLTMPLLSLLTKNEYRKTLWYTVGVFFITNSLIPCILKSLGIEYNGDLSIQIGKYIVFVILGFLLSTGNIEKKKRILIYCLGVFSMAFRYAITLVMSKKTNELYGIFFLDMNSSIRYYWQVQYFFL